jgi:hypothetical protein
MQIIDDDTREFHTSQMVRLELPPKARFEKHPREVAFYEAHFSECKACEPSSELPGLDAEKLAARYGLAGPDAPQLSAAVRPGWKSFTLRKSPANQCSG